MFTQWKKFRTSIITLITCLSVVLLSSPIVGQVFAHLPTATPTNLTAAAYGDDFKVGEQIDANLAAAMAPLLAQGVSSGRAMTYVAMLNSSNVVPGSPKTKARGVVGAALSGNRLVVRGSFRRLSSTPRDYATDPVNPPNTNITSAFHIHRGSSMENGPFQYALDVTLDPNSLNGRAMGDFTLTPDQLQALQNGMLYVDFHTTRYRGGEIRGGLMPS